MVDKPQPDNVGKLVGSFKILRDVAEELISPFPITLADRIDVGLLL